MKVTRFTRECLTVRRETRDLKAAGYRRCEPDWTLMCGGRWNEVLTEAKISADGKHIWFKSAPKAKQMGVGE